MIHISKWLQALSAAGRFNRRFSPFFESGKARDLCQELLSRPEFFKKKVALSTEACRYTVALRYGGHSEYEPNNLEVFWETSCGLALKCDDRIVAILGFVVRKGYLVIVQIQGVEGSEMQLKPLRWQQLLVAFLEQLATEGGYYEVRMIQAQHSEYYGLINNASDSQAVTCDQEDLHQRRLETHLDGTARSMGFKLDPQGRLWVHQLGGSAA